MGDERFQDATPRQVTVSAFAVMRTEVTEAQWRSVIPELPSRVARCEGAGGTTGDCPVVGATWRQVVEFANAMSKVEGLTPAYTIADDTVTWSRDADGYRLPTEAEWELAARSDRRLDQPITDVAWCKDNAQVRQPVCAKGPGLSGLCDILGNVEELVWDSYSPFPSEQVADPAFHDRDHPYVVVRGGSASTPCHELHPARRRFRGRDAGVIPAVLTGFRLARNTLGE